MENATEAPAAAKSETAHLIARLADNKYFLGRYFAEWCSGAPTLESAVASAAMAQDELGQARALYPLLRAIQPEAGEENEPESRTVFSNLSCLDEPFPAWEDFVAANVLIDGALTTVFAAATASSYRAAGGSRAQSAAGRAHPRHAWCGLGATLAREGGAMRSACRQALMRILAETLCWFGPEGDDTLSVTQVLDAAPDELRTRFLASLAPELEAEQLALPVRKTGDGLGAHSSRSPGRTGMPSAIAGVWRHQTPRR